MPPQVLQQKGGDKTVVTATSKEIKTENGTIIKVEEKISPDDSKTITRDATFTDGSTTSSKETVNSDKSGTVTTTRTSNGVSMTTTHDYDKDGTPTGKIKTETSANLQHAPSSVDMNNLQLKTTTTPSSNSSTVGKTSKSPKKVKSKK